MTPIPIAPRLNASMATAIEYLTKLTGKEAANLCAPNAMAALEQATLALPDDTQRAQLLNLLAQVISYCHSADVTTSQDSSIKLQRRNVNWNSTWLAPSEPPPLPAHATITAQLALGAAIFIAVIGVVKWFTSKRKVPTRSVQEQPGTQNAQKNSYSYDF
ncbi:hypothetical protein BDR26DRAFT_967677 [Obelidium mucronatum]|nr:hypothetical protein BDR26DRAFT_967677 [Obelidium mucronatum]